MKESTFSTYEVLLHKHILPYFGEATTICKTDLQDFVLEKLDMGYSMNSVQLMALIIRTILRHGATLGLCENPDWHIRYPSAHKGKKLSVYSIEDQRLILRGVRKYLSPRSLGIYLALASGMRIGELCALQWREVDLRGGVVRVRQTLGRIYQRGEERASTKIIVGSPKTPGSVRDIPIPDDLITLLIKMAAGRNGDDFVLTACPKPTEPRAYRNYYNSFLDKLEIPRQNFHALRHSFATRCIEAGFDAKTVSSLLGHANINTTLDLYVHPGFDKKKACVNSINLTL